MKDQEAENFLEKRFKGNPRFTVDETVQTAISALQSVLAEDFKVSTCSKGIAYLAQRTIHSCTIQSFQTAG